MEDLSPVVWTTRRRDKQIGFKASVHEEHTYVPFLSTSNLFCFIAPLYMSRPAASVRIPSFSKTCLLRRTSYFLFLSDHAIWKKGQPPKMLSWRPTDGMDTFTYLKTQFQAGGIYH